MLALLLLACVGDPTLSITSPSEGDVFEVFTPITLEAEVLDAKGEVADSRAVQWRMGAWSATGSPVHLDEGLPFGDHDLTATVEVDGREATATTTLSVRQLLRETAFEGLLTMDIHMWSTEYGDFDFVCEHDDLSFFITPEGQLSGQGTCTSPLGQEVFALDGTLDVDDLSGTMTTASEDTEESLPFEGSLDEDMHVAATYDHTFFTPDEKGSLRLYGSFEADPVTSE